MKKKNRLIVRYALLGVVSIAACVVAAVVLLDRDREIPDQGLVPGLTDSLAHGVPSRAPKLRFTRVPLDFEHFPGSRSHRLPEDMGSGVAMQDLDGDGDLDLFLVNLGPLGSEQPPCALFENLGEFRFERVETRLPALMGQGVAAGDYDADGDLDLYVTGYGGSVLLRNDGRMRFVDVTDEAGVRGGGFCTGACWGDADGDGDLDLYVCRYVTFDGQMPVRESRRGTHGLPVTLNPSAFPAQANLLFLNDGETFREAAEEYGVANEGGKSLAAVFADFDGDGVLDLYVANDVSDNAMYRGVKGEPYEDVTHRSCTADWRGAMGLAVGDPDGDTDLDLFITHWLPEENTLYVKQSGQLFFADASAQTLLGPAGRGLVGWACDFLDLDCDGFADLFVVNGSTFEQASAKAFLEPMPMQLFWNDRGKRFFDLGPKAGEALQKPIVGRGGTSGDLDGDGDVDLVVVSHGAAPLLLRNDTQKEHNHLTVVVRGSVPNVFGYGALVTVEAGGRAQTQQVGAKVSYLSAGPHELHFGLGAARTARVRVRYASGVQVVRSNVRAGSRLLVKEVDPRTLGAYMDKARTVAAAEAREVYGEVLRLDPLHPSALYNLAILADPPEALELCNSLLKVEPFAPRGHLLKARILSDPSRPALMDLDRALTEIALARRLNRDETGGLLEHGRVLLLKGEIAAAAETLEKVKSNPRGAALAALCRYRLEDAEGAQKLLALHRGHPAAGLSEEGDTAGKKMGARDLLARLLELQSGGRWELLKLPIGRLDGADCEFVDLNDDSSLDARIGARQVILREKRVVETRPGAGVKPVPRTPFERYDFEQAAAWALDPPERCDGPPPGATATVEADADGDGDLDLFVACGGDDPAAPLPWWLLLREDDHFRPVRGALPEPGFCVAALAVADLDGDGRAEVLLKGGGFLPKDAGPTWLASLR